MNSLKLLREPRSMMLLGLDFLLLGVLAGWLISPPRVNIPSAKPVEMAALGGALAAADPAGPDLSQAYASLIDQPVFHQDRIYTPPPKVDATPVQSSPPDFVLTGYLEIQGRPAKAFLRERSGGRTLSVTTGDPVDGWTVVGVSSRHALLRQGDRTAEVIRGGAPIAGVAAAEAAPAPSIPAAPVVRAAELQAPPARKTSAAPAVVKPKRFTVEAPSQGAASANPPVLSQQHSWETVALPSVSVAAQRPTHNRETTSAEVSASPAEASPAAAANDPH